jgi:homoserine kinase type II
MTEIHPLLSRYPADCQPSHIEPLGSAGGMSGAQFWRLTAPKGFLALRRWPVEHPSPERLQFIHALLTHAIRGGVSCLPLPIANRNGQTFAEHAGHLWELAPWLSGTADYERSPSTEKLRAALRALARFHVATADFPQRLSNKSEPAPIRHLSRLRQLEHGGIDQLMNAIRDTTWPELAPLARRFVAALPCVVPRAIAQLEPLPAASLPLQPCVRDIWHDHVLYTGNEVTGLIDFGAVDIDTPATDIARLLGSLAGDDATDWQAGLAAYSAIRPLTHQETLAVFALDASGTILAGCNWIRWLHTERRQFENPGHIVARFRAIVARIEFVSQPPSGNTT